ncbi:DUF4440 domain-containing protein [Bacillus sp. H-16]|uniref:DUF4440 domain-containing protein n=1 Tax=Alteribacter keqinensis TaxID=2483800 RepID=A0A3M7TP18_9BACI|nr:DUF4440 domain-containing protein [Alteribacter keqinensis]MBM7094994.1 DUF4440 domain-containing protein [Alteribacter salitolerans]RNA67192.1 DUF4440 domain-containing protein [Alteribacter keqinensis]
MKENTQLKERIKELEVSLLSPAVRTNPVKINELLHDDFFEHGSSGVVFYKKDCTGEGGVGVREMTLSGFSLHSLGENDVLATYVCDDQTRKVRSLRSSVWRFESGRWQMFFHQGTVMRDSSQV